MVFPIFRMLTLILAIGVSLGTEAAPRSVELVRLYIHGINSNASTWNDVLGGSNCPVVRSGVPVTVFSRCYRLQFADRIVNGITWPAGDGATLNQLRAEIERAISQIRVQVEPRHLILVGHSRGGLGIRSYVQNLPEAVPFPIGLVLIGTPHQGTPLGRIAVWGRDNSVNPADVARELRFAFGPGAAEFATDADSNGQLIRTTISRRIFTLNNGVSLLTQRASAIGQISSAGLRLGENVSGDFDALSDVGAQLLAFITPGSFDDLLGFVLQNIALISERPVLIDTFSCANERRLQYPFACDGDGVVPRISQHLELVPGYVEGATPLRAVELTNVPHGRELRRVNVITNLVNQVRADLIPQ